MLHRRLNEVAKVAGRPDIEHGDSRPLVDFIFRAAARALHPCFLRLHPLSTTLTSLNDGMPQMPVKGHPESGS